MGEGRRSGLWPLGGTLTALMGMFVLGVVLQVRACDAQIREWDRTNGQVDQAHDDTVTDEEAFAAGLTAFADSRARFAGDWEVARIGRVGPETFGAVYIRVVIRGGVKRVPPAECTIDHSDNMTGVVYLVSDPPKTVEAISPEWDSGVSCLGATAP